GLLLGDVGELHHPFAEPGRRLLDDLAICELVAARPRDLASDLVAEAADGGGNSHDAHDPPPCWAWPVDRSVSAAGKRRGRLGCRMALPWGLASLRPASRATAGRCEASW